MTNHIPKLSEVAVVRLAIECESVLDFSRFEDEDEADRRAREAARDYAKRLADVVGWEHVDLTEEAEESQHTSEWQCYAVTCHVDITPEQWLEVANGFCIDLDWIRHEDAEAPPYGHRTDDPAEIPALPEDDIVPTQGILGADGLVPAVAIESTGEGWGYGGYEPVMMTSFYVALLLKSPEELANAIDLTDNMRALLREHGFGAAFFNGLTPEEEALIPECPYDDDSEAQDDWNTEFAQAMEARA